MLLPREDESVAICPLNRCAVSDARDLFSKHMHLQPRGPAGFRKSVRRAPNANAHHCTGCDGEAARWNTNSDRSLDRTKDGGKRRQPDAALERGRPRTGWGASPSPSRRAAIWSLRLSMRRTGKWRGRWLDIRTRDSRGAQWSPPFPALSSGACRAPGARCSPPGAHQLPRRVGMDAPRPLGTYCPSLRSFHAPCSICTTETARASRPLWLVLLMS